MSCALLSEATTFSPARSVLLDLRVLRGEPLHRMTSVRRPWWNDGLNRRSVSTTTRQGCLRSLGHSLHHALEPSTYSRCQGTRVLSDSRVGCNTPVDSDRWTPTRASVEQCNAGTGDCYRLEDGHIVKGGFSSTPIGSEVDSTLDPSKMATVRVLVPAHGRHVQCPKDVSRTHPPR